MNTQPDNAVKTPRKGVVGPGECQVLQFPPRAPRLAKVDYGSGWYHDAAIAEACPPPARIR